MRANRSNPITMATNPTASFIAGGFAGGIATMATMPLEVIKTRLQSNVGQEVMKLYRLVPQGVLHSTPYISSLHNGTSVMSTTTGPRLLNYLRHVVRTEGPRALFKGLSLTLIGSVPTRAIYFSLYSNFKPIYSRFMDRNSNAVHFLSGMSANITTSSLTSPIWVVKTQLQLDNRPKQLLSLRQCTKTVYKTDGLRGFYRGLSASYAGSFETAIHFMIYERLKLTIRADKDVPPTQCMLIAAFSKMVASSLCYPHEVCRTRLRQNVERSQRKYNSFVQTLLKIWREEGSRGLYGGMAAHQLRVVPNASIMFLCYEGIVRLMGFVTL